MSLEPRSWAGVALLASLAMSTSAGCTCEPTDAPTSEDTAPREPAAPPPAPPPAEPVAPPPVEEVAAVDRPIPEACDVSARAAVVDRRATLSEVAALVSPPDVGAPDDEIARSLCGSLELALGSSNCPSEGPWPALADAELVLVRRRGDGYDVVRGLGLRSDGTESASYLTNVTLRRREPIVLALEEERSEQVCDGEGDEEICGMADVAVVSRVALERDEGAFAIVDVTVPVRERDALGLEPPSVVGETGGLRVTACGGSARVSIGE